MIVLKRGESAEAHSLVKIQAEIDRFEVQKNRILRNQAARLEFDSSVKDWGYPSIPEFLLELGYLSDETGKRTRTKVSTEARQKIVEDISSKTMTPQQIADKHGVSVDTVYNIKSVEGLTEGRKKKPQLTDEETTRLRAAEFDKWFEVPTPVVATERMEVA